MIIPAKLGVTALILCFISNPIMCLTETVQKMSLMTPSGGALCTEHIKNGHVHRAKRKKKKASDKTSRLDSVQANAYEAD